MHANGYHLTLSVTDADTRNPIEDAEASVALHDGSRVRAAALRLEAHRGSWRVTVLQIG